MSVATKLRLREAYKVLDALYGDLDDGQLEAHSRVQAGVSMALDALEEAITVHDAHRKGSA